MLSVASLATLTLTFVLFTACDLSEANCGPNPVNQIQMVAQRTGKTVQYVLSVLREIDLPAFDLLAAKFRQYASCVGLMDTGFFRKRSDALPISVQDPKHQDQDRSYLPSSSLSAAAASRRDGDDGFGDGLGDLLLEAKLSKDSMDDDLNLRS